MLYCTFHSDLKEGISMGFIPTVGYPAPGKETHRSGLYKWRRQHAFMPGVFFFKCPWGIAN